MRNNMPFQLVFLALAITFAVQRAHAQESYKFVRQWGSHGTGPEQFGHPAGLAVDRHGQLYVADLENDRVQRFRVDGSFVSMWGASGSTAGKFDGPDGVAIDTSGNVYVTDFRNYRVQKFAANGQFILTWGVNGLDPGFFKHPAGIAADTIGNIFVADHEDPIVQSSAGLDPLRDRVEKFTKTGGFLLEWGGSGTGPGQFNGPEGVAVDRSGNVYVCDAVNNRIQKFSNSGAYITQWGSYGTAPGEFRNPVAIAVDRTSHVFVADADNSRIQKFASTGTFMTEWGTPGSGAGEFSGPDGLAVDDSGFVYVADGDNSRIQVFGPSPHVLLVHGICGSASSWATFAQVLSDSGFIAHTIQLGDTTYNLPARAYVPALAAKLDSIASDHILVIAHSMGGLVTGEYIRRQTMTGESNKVAQLVTLGTPYHGSDLVQKLVALRNVLDLGCAQKFPGSVCDTVGQLRNFLGCLGDRKSALALHDLSPASAFLNLLDYGTQANLYDSPGSHGWDAHQPENLSPRVYYASIAGTRSFCPTPFEALRTPIWDRGANYHVNDGAVAIGSSLLTNTSAFRAQDVDVPSGSPLVHAVNKYLCGKPYYLSDTLARKVASILDASPSGPPVTASMKTRAVIAATTEDSLQATPAITDTILVGQVQQPTRVVPQTTQMVVTLVSDDARLTLRRPNGTSITPSDTSTANGIGFFGNVGSGFEGYVIANPATGTWTFRVDASSSAAKQLYGCVVSYVTSAQASLSPRALTVFPGDSIRVRSSLAIGGVRQTGLTWTCRVIGPGNVATSLTLLDDGAHGDSLAGDGFYGNATVPTAGFGPYRIVASATTGAGETFAAGGNCEYSQFDDLSALPERIWFVPNLFNAGDSVTVNATVRNNGTRAALGVKVDIRDVSIGLLLGTSTVDVPAGSDVTVQARWKAAFPDTHTIRVVISPYVFELETNYANNVGSRTVVLGTPVGVDPRRQPLRTLEFAPPIPNPSRGLVTFAFRTPQRASATLEILDVLGRRLRRWTWGDLDAGDHSVEWNGRNDKGLRVTPGIMLCRVRVGAEVKTRKLVLRP